MKIELQDVQPEPIPEKETSDSEVWRSNLVLESGKRHLVSGVSGRGKSTLLHLICGIRQDFSGQLLLDDRDSAVFSEKDWTNLRSRRAALLFQDLRLFPNLSALENLELLASRDPSAPSPEDMAKRLGVDEYLKTPSGNLSQGQRQRMSLIRALCRSFEILLLDEPFSHLDEENTRLACQLVDEELERRQAGLILSALDDASGLNFDYTWKL